jgi:hypothetical protein
MLDRNLILFVCSRVRDKQSTGRHLDRLGVGVGLAMPRRERGL